MIRYGELVDIDGYGLMADPLQVLGVVPIPDSGDRADRRVFRKGYRSFVVIAGWRLCSRATPWVIRDRLNRVNGGAT